MHYVIIRDDDTNAFTPVECLERLYRPFLNAGLPINLAVIPDVSLTPAWATVSQKVFYLSRTAAEAQELRARIYTQHPTLFLPKHLPRGGRVSNPDAQSPNIPNWCAIYM